MPTCPNCGSYIPLGNHSCSCGTTIRYADDDDDERRYSEWEAIRRRQMEYRRQRQRENPYEDDFFNDLHHKGASSMLLSNMNSQVQFLKDRFNAKLDDVVVIGNLAIFVLEVHEEYFDAKFRASFDMTNSFGDLVLLKDTVVPDFERLYSNEEFQRLIASTESKTGYKFEFCKVLIIDDTLMVSAYFDNGGAWTVDLDDMSLVE